jgi:hypothetical protein
MRGVHVRTWEVYISSDLYWSSIHMAYYNARDSHPTRLSSLLVAKQASTIHNTGLSACKGY